MKSSNKFVRFNFLTLDLKMLNRSVLCFLFFRIQSFDNFREQYFVILWIHKIDNGGLMLIFFSWYRRFAINLITCVLAKVWVNSSRICFTRLRTQLRRDLTRFNLILNCSSAPLPSSWSNLGEDDVWISTGFWGSRSDTLLSGARSGGWRLDKSSGGKICSRTDNIKIGKFNDEICLFFAFQFLHLF